MKEITAIQPQLHPALANTRLQLAIYTATGRLVDKRKSTVDADSLPDYQELRTQANDIKRHAIDHLDHYLELFERNVEANGGKVIWCRDGKEVVDFLLTLAKQRKSKILVKSKSMTTEEIHLNDHLEEHGLEPVETDLGEYILQLAHEKPYHIVAPALHMTRYEVADLFEEKLQLKREEVPEKQTQIARGILREKFLEADIGVSGANFLVADSGAVVLVENEGNARLSTTAPKVHVAVAGIEKVIPRAQDLATFLKLLGRSGTGQQLTVYTSFLSGPRRKGEIDGPEEFYVVLLDNGRTKVLQDADKRQALFCIRCGACLNICPVYRRIGGHNYPWVYSGPIGAILTPQFKGLDKDPWLPHASSLCGACGEVCPVKIEIPRLLLELRADIEQAKAAKGEDKSEKLGFQAWAKLMSSPQLYRAASAAGSWVLQDMGDGGWSSKLPFFMNLGPAKGWLSARDMPLPPGESFRQLWRNRRKQDGTQAQPAQTQPSRAGKTSQGRQPE
ncbi:MAG: iron-sulfur cluster-binding protein [Bryobacterales bacterium]|nr:iron-sulfur cluster-binding protein [Bryobacterales bacterium]